jgi:hypothetical protein
MILYLLTFRNEKRPTRTTAFIPNGEARKNKKTSNGGRSRKVSWNVIQTIPALARPDTMRKTGERLAVFSGQRLGFVRRLHQPADKSDSATRTANNAETGKRFLGMIEGKKHLKRREGRAMTKPTITRMVEILYYSKQDAMNAGDIVSARWLQRIVNLLEDLQTDDHDEYDDEDEDDWEDEDEDEDEGQDLEEVRQ